MTIRTAAVTAMTAGAFLSAAASANHIDFMVDGPFTINDGSSMIVAGNPDNILGGERFVSVDSVDAIAQFSNGDNVITFDALGTAEATLTLSYGDFAGGDPFNADFASQWSAIAVNFASVTGEGMLSLEIESTIGLGTSAQNLVTTAGEYIFEFDQPVYNGVDFNDVDRVTLELNASPGAEFEIESITRVPAPAGAALAGLVGFAALRRRR
ncbi:MAG: hypothetical protein ACTS27_03640 [Phycisphaerales bacterium]